MNGKMFGRIILVGGILLTLIGALWAIRALPSQAEQPPPPLANLLLQERDFPERFKCERYKQDAKEQAREVAEFIGLPLDYLEGQSVYFVLYSPPHPKAVAQALYRYGTEKEALAHYEQLLEALPAAPLGRGTPIISRSKWSFRGVKGQIIEAQDPIGIAYWFVGVRGKLLTIMVVLSTESTGQPLFKELLPIGLGRMAGS